MTNNIDNVRSLEQKFVKDIDIYKLNIRDNNSEKIKLGNDPLSALKEVLDSSFNSNVKNLILIDNFTQNPSKEYFSTMQKIADKFCNNSNENKVILIGNGDISSHKGFIIYTNDHKFYSIIHSKGLQKTILLDHDLRESNLLNSILISYHQKDDSGKSIIYYNGEFVFDQKSSQLISVQFQNKYEWIKWNSNHLSIEDLPSDNDFHLPLNCIGNVLNQAGENFIPEIAII